MDHKPPTAKASASQQWASTSPKRFLVPIESQYENGPSDTSPPCYYHETAITPAYSVDQFKDLHEAIADGDEDLVRSLLEKHPQEEWFTYDDASALFVAFSNKKYSIASHLIHIGAKIDNSEVENLEDFDEEDLIHVNCLLSEYNKKSERSSLFRLLSYSQSPQGLDGERLAAVTSTYEEFFESEILRFAMKVVAAVEVDIVYDFESEDVNRIHRCRLNESEFCGLTRTISREIYVGAKGLISGDPRKRAKVLGVIAEELCHLAMTVLFENDAKPYEQGDARGKVDFGVIVSEVESLTDRNRGVESVVVDVYRNYDECEWECELIARVPHLIGIYGEEPARKILRESPELSSLLAFYERNVLAKCKAFTDPSVNTKGHAVMEKLTERNQVLSFEEKTATPLKEGFRTFRDFCVEEEGVSIITTNCTKLCTLHVYHELKREHEESVEKMCVFFSRKYLDGNFREILDALKFNVWKYFVLVLDKKQLSLTRLKTEYLDHFETSRLKLIVISGLKTLGDRFNAQAVNYGWDDLCEGYKTLLQLIKCVLKGRERGILVEKEDFPKFFSKEDILDIISGEIPEISDGVELLSQGYSPETYIGRSFRVTAVTEDIFKNIPADSAVFLSGVRETEIDEFFGDSEKVQVLKGEGDQLRFEKSVFVSADGKPTSFANFAKKSKKAKCIWLHRRRKLFYLWDTSRAGDAFDRYLKAIGENDMVDFLERKKTVIISDDAGCGKSTAISSLIRNVQERIHYSWVFRVDLVALSVGQNNELSLGNVGEDAEQVYDYLFRVLKLRTGLEKLLFRRLAETCFIFFDGLDEIAPKFIENALHLLTTLRNTSSAKLVISTRKHHQYELEDRMNTFSHRLIPFSREDQLDYLEKHWRYSLKYLSRKHEMDEVRVRRKIDQIIEESEEGGSKPVSEYKELILALRNVRDKNGADCLREEVDALDFSKFAAHILDSTSLDEEFLKFMGIPLHLFMVASVYFNGNFNVKIGSDIYSLYCEFVEQKILIYVEEKVRLLTEGIGKDMVVDDMREKAFLFHVKLANEFFDERMESEMGERDRKFVSAIGIVHVDDGEVAFLHTTFAEFFKSESIMKNVEKEAFLETVFETRYEFVRKFISCALARRESERLRNAIFKDLGCLVEMMRRACERRSVDFLFIRKFLKGFREVDDPGLFEEFVRELDRVAKSAEGNDFEIGKCGNLEIVKRMVKSFDGHKWLLLGFVSVSETDEEVVEVFDEYVSKTNEEEQIVNLLSIYNVLGVYFSPAFEDQGVEIITRLLKVLRSRLGEERFVAKVIRSEGYREQFNSLVDFVDTDYVCRLFEVMRSEFGGDLNAFFDDGFKLNVVTKALREMSLQGDCSSFENVMGSLERWFGRENLREVLLRESDEHSHREHLIHLFMKAGKDDDLTRCWRLVEEVLGDRIKGFFTAKDKYWNNIFHSAARNEDEVNFDCLGSYLSPREIMDLLLERNRRGETCLHAAADFNFRNFSATIDYVHELLHSDLIRFEEVVLAQDYEEADTFLHYIFKTPFDTPFETLREILNNLSAKLGDELFKKLLITRNKGGGVFLNADEFQHREESIEYLKGFLEEEVIEEISQTAGDYSTF